jgi:hypothetical protein
MQRAWERHRGCPERTLLGVDWDECCLNFHQSDRPVQTPSRWQVRQPIYSRSVLRWRHYEPYLPGLGASEFRVDFRSFYK